MTKGGFILLVLAFMMGEFFCAQNIWAAELPAVIINEVAWMGTDASANNEWLELKNLTEQPLDLTGWTLKAADNQPNIALSGRVEPNGFYLLKRTSDETLPSITADQIYTGALGNAGEILELKDANGNVIDKLEASAGWPGGDNTSKATLERKADLSWATSKLAGGTPRSENSVFEQIVILPPVDNINQATDTSIIVVPVEGTALTAQPANNVPLNLPVRISPQAGEVVINEMVSDPNDGEEEWVELYLNSNRDFDTKDWTLEDGSKTKTVLSGHLNGSKRFLVIDNPKGNLNNAGDVVILRDERGVLLDQLTYGNWAGASGVEAPRDGKALARRFDGVTSFNNASDFALTTTPTKAAANQITGAVGESPALTKSINYKDLVINEFLPNPIGNDEVAEWVELKNKGPEAIELAGWRLGLSNNYYKFASGTIAAGEFRVVKRSESKLALLNTSGTLKLFPPLSQSASQSVHYDEVREGQGYALDDSNLWQWTLTPTPGSVNMIKKTNEAPQVELYFETPAEVGQLVLFDSSDTVDADGDPMSYFWQLGDGATSNLANPQHAYAKAGSYHVKLTVSDGLHKVSLEKNLKINKSSLPVVTKEVIDYNKAKIIINEFLPNPAGTDDGEWIELYNRGTEQVNLQGWQLDDEEGGSKPYKIEEELELAPGQFAVFERSETNLALNNTNDEVRLFNPLGQLVDQVGYQKASEDLAFARNTDNEWQWTSVATPGAVNVLNYQGQLKIKSTKLKSKKVKSKNSQTATNQNQVIGTVISLPGQFGSQYFYLQNQAGGYQVYSYKKDFPDLKLGEVLEVTGVLSEVNSEARLKITKAADIKILRANKDLTPERVSCEAVSEKYLGKLVEISGELTKRSGASVYLDDGTDETLIYLKQGTGLKAANLKIGESYRVIGVLTNAKTGWRLLPRQEADIVSLATSTESLGQVASGSGETLAARNGHEKTLAYVEVLGGGGLVLAAGWLVRKRFGE